MERHSIVLEHHSIDVNKIGMTFHKCYADVWSKKPAPANDVKNRCLVIA
jgi:hypothetical protein